MNHLTAQELALYLGCYVQVRKKNDSKKPYLIGRICEVTDRSNHGNWVKVKFEQVHTVTNDTFHELSSDSHTFFIGHDEAKPILRRLSSMTERECEEVLKITRSHAMPLTFFPVEIKTLLSLHFDLFGYIDSGKALDKATL